MESTLPAPRRTLDPPTAATLSRLLDDAAALIDRCGLYEGGYWEGDLLLDYRRGIPVDAVGALAVVAGHRRQVDVEVVFLGQTRYDPRSHTHVGGTGPHPVVRALMTHARLQSIEGLYAWSDCLIGPEVAIEMRVCAAMIRIGARS